jgi:hypothetical protein
VTRAAVAAALGALAVAAAAGAGRAPTHEERVAIIRALPADVRAWPVGCVSLSVTVSSHPGWAKVDADFLIPIPTAPREPCVKYASNGVWVLRHAKTWKVVYEASELPGCSLGIPRDLLPCAKGR